MAKAVDPEARAFVDSTVFTGGKYNGHSIEEVARSRKGLLFLYELAEFTPENCKWLGHNLLRAIKSYLQRSEVIFAVTRVLREQREGTSREE